MGYNTYTDMLKTVVIAVLIFMLVLKCNSTPRVTTTQVEYYTDTVTTTHIDTIEFVKTFTTTKTVLDTQIVYISPDGTETIQFNSYVEDSLLRGQILTNIYNTDTGLALNYQTIRYTPKFPKYIHQIDSVTIHDSVVVTKFDNKINFMLGANLFIPNNNNLKASVMPTIGVQLKNKTYLELGYDPFNTSFMFGTKVKLNFSKK